MSNAHEDIFGEALSRTAPNKFYVKGDKDEDQIPTGKYSLFLKKNGGYFGSFNVKTLPGCCGVAVLSYVQVGYFPAKDKDKLIAKHKEVIDIVVKAAYLAKYGMVLATQRADATVLPAYPSTAGWSNINAFNNGKTNNDILTLFLNLKQPKPEPAKPGIVTGGE